MPVEFTDPGPAVTPAELDALEERLAVTLPADYRAFLLETNGGLPRPRWVRIGKKERLLGRFLSVGHPRPRRDLEQTVRRARARRMQPNLLPFAFMGDRDEEDRDLELACLVLSGEGEGEVRRWTAPYGNEPRGTVHRLAPGFREMLDGLHYHPSTLPWMELLDRDDREGLAAWLDGGGDPNAADHDGETILGHAALAGRRELVGLLADRGASTAGLLSMAVSKRDPELLRLALRGKVGGDDLPMVAAMQGLTRWPDILQLLEERGFDPNCRPSWGASPVETAAASGQAQTLRWLLRLGGEADTPGAGGETPLHAAVRAGSLECVQVLVEAGADPDGRVATPCTLPADWDDRMAEAEESSRNAGCMARVLGPLALRMIRRRAERKLRRAQSPRELARELWEPEQVRELEEWLASRLTAPRG